MSKNGNTTNQFENLEHENIKYSREGGYFVTTRKAIIYIVITLLLSAVVGVVVYEYGPRKNWPQIVTEQENIQDLLTRSISNIPSQDIRLPQNVKPIHYKLKIQPNIENLTLVGEVFIMIEALERTKSIVLNVDFKSIKLGDVSIYKGENIPKQNDMVTIKSNITQVRTNSSIASTPKVQNKEASSPLTSPVADQERIERIPIKKEHNQIAKVLATLTVVSKQINNANLQYVILLSNALTPGNTYTLEITFRGNISQSLEGLHENSYVDRQGQKKYIIASHLQPVSARRVFPCFDEPSMKATFEISIVHKENMNSLSNMPIKSSKNLGNGWIEDEFEVTPPIPTFLVAMTLLEKQYYSSVNGSGNLKIWVPKEHLKYVSYPLEQTEKIMKYYAKHFDMDYPLPKLDIVTIPTLPSTATENWGLILFKESVLLNGEDKREIFSFLAKKIAQQWFGNLVSITWWNDLWLIKGFALLEADEASIKIYNWTSDFTLRVTQTMLGLDDFESSTILQPNITNLLQINQLYDSVTHYKGGCLLRMLQHSLPDTLFQNATQQFLKRWKFQAVNQSAFWNSVNELAKPYLPAGMSVSDIMKKWSFQSGYPLITVTRNKGMNGINVVQSKFPATNASNSIWIVPLNYVIGNRDECKLWLVNHSITITNVSTNEWILFNVRRTGYYRVNYDEDNWNVLIQVLNTNHKAIPLENRGQLINDAFKLAENGLLDYAIPFNLTKYLHKEERYIPWASVLNSLEFLKHILQSTYLNGAYEEYIRELVSPLYDKLWNITDGHQLLRKLIIETACNANYDLCVEWAKDLFTDWMENNVSVPNDLRKTIFCSAIRAGGKDEWEFVWNQINLQKTIYDIKELFMALGCTRDTWLINKYLRNALSGTIPWQYVPYVWESLSQPTSLAFGFKYVRENWDVIYQTYKEKPIILKAIVRNLLYALSNKSDLEDLTTFVSKHQLDFQQLAADVQGAVDRIKVRVEWSSKHLFQVEQLLPH